MKRLSGNELRQMFLDYFEERGHEVRPPHSLIPDNDPTLLWINSGVATLKKYFDGSQTPKNPNMTNSQKSIRTNDIENVGVTARHHTLFEMLGNFSIGDYHKEQAIKYAWEFLTSPDYMDMDQSLLYVTYHPEDTETKEIWESIEDFDSSHLVEEEGNFWDIGSGPCGPNTEIFYDRGIEYLDIPEDDPEHYPGGENERYLEVWNLVFSELNHMPDDTYEPLPNKNVDTGMGLERLASLSQDTETNFETDLFMPIINEIEKISGISYSESDDNFKTSFKVIADHIRAVSMAISDGALPSNEGRGYIIRRLIRRSVVHGRRLGIDGFFLTKLVGVVISVMGDYYTDLQQNEDYIKEIIADEEKRFHNTIEGGENKLSEIITELKNAKETQISGKQAFLLYDTFGFPLELTQELAEEEGLSVDVDEFNVEMEAQRERARSAREKVDSMSAQSETMQNITSDFEFLGYERLVSEATIEAIVQDDEMIEKLAPNSKAWVIFNRSPFYAEGGGQVGDKGLIYDGDDEVANVLDTQKAPHGQHMHLVETGELPLNTGQSYTLSVDRNARVRTTKNHTGTHLLHYAVHQVLGEHANQAGSLVAPDRLRFDFSYFGKVSDEDLIKIEDIVNEMIARAIPVDISYMTMQEAKDLGAIMLFEGSYEDTVRVININNESVELCGGNHVNNTMEIGAFKIVSESGIGAGMRRIEALTGPAAVDYFRQREALLNEVAAHLKVQDAKQITKKIDQLQDELKKANSEIESLTTRLMQGDSESIFDNVQEAGDLTYISYQIDNQDVDHLRQLGDMWRQKNASDIFVVVSPSEESATLLVFVSDAKVDSGVKAGDIIKPLASKIGGGGGGRPHMAQAGGRQLDQIPAMIDSIGEVLVELYPAE